GFFNSLTEIAQAKGEIYSGLTLGGLACMNLAEPLHAVWQASLPQYEITQFSYGTPGSSCYLAKAKDDGSIIISTNQGNLQTKLQVLGKHNCYNAVTAAALAVNLNCSLEAISQGLANYAGYKGRLQPKAAFNGALIIDDSYNANPDSVKAAIIAIQNLPKPHWFIFADLRELGKFSSKFHQEIGQFAANNGIDMLLTVGEMAAITNASFNGKKMHFSSNQDIVEYCLHYLPVTATLLIKGSNSMGLGTLVEQLTASIR
ncbi:MAG: glutamate ligase domain-containing protein, partial [Burkholderiales bacterium]